LHREEGRSARGLVKTWSVFPRPGMWAYGDLTRGPSHFERLQNMKSWPPVAPLRSYCTRNAPGAPDFHRGFGTRLGEQVLGRSRQGENRGEGNGAVWRVETASTFTWLAGE